MEKVLQKNTGKTSYWEKIGRIAFVHLPVVVIFSVILTLLVSIAFSLYILFLIVSEVFEAADKFAFVTAVASLLEFAFVISMTYLISLKLFLSLIKPRIQQESIILDHVYGDLEELKPIFLSIIVSIISLYILEVATIIIKNVEAESLDKLVILIAVMLSLAIVAAIISAIKNRGEKIVEAA